MAKKHDYRVFRAPAHEEAIASQLNDLDEQGYHLVASLPIGTDCGHQGGSQVQTECTGDRTRRLTTTDGQPRESRDDER
jgi:hypothetical protein